MISMGVLSWHAHETLRKTLTSYIDLKRLVDEAVVFFNEISEADRSIANEFGFKAAGSESNLGIYGGTKAMIESLHGDKILSLQNDCPVNVSPEVLKSQIEIASQILDSGIAEVVRLRDRFAPGFSDKSKFLRYWPGDDRADTIKKKIYRLFRPFHARRMKGRAVAVLQKPEERFPNVFTRHGDFWISDSSYINFTDQPFMAKRDFLLRLFDYAEKHKEGSRTLNKRPVLEIILNNQWWRRQHFKVAISTGVFAHDRYDDSFRSTHVAFNPLLKDSL